MKTSKSVLFPCVVKSLCNNLELLAMINGLGQGISYNLVSLVVIPDEEDLRNAENNIAIMVADIDNLENTATGLGTHISEETQTTQNFQPEQCLNKL